MIRRVVNKIFRYTLITLVLMHYILLPMSVEAAVKTNVNGTFLDLKNTLKEYQQKKRDNDNKKKLTKSEINTNRNKVLANEQKIEDTKEEMISIENTIEHTNSEISDVKVQTEDLLRLYQKLESDNFYMEYITGANTVTELIMRMDAIKRLTEYNEAKLDELETMINNNEKLSVELQKYEKKLDAQIVEYQKSIESLNGELAELEEGALTIEDDIKTLQDLIKYYNSIGCKDNQKLSTCLAVANSDRWVKPVAKGRITSLYGKRKSPTAGASSYHRGIDIGVGEGTPVYPTAKGKVAAISLPTSSKNACGGKKLYIWVTVKGVQYTIVYMHLLSINTKVGADVDINTVVAYSGGGPRANATNAVKDPCSTGAHLHYGVAKGWWGSDSKHPLSSFNANTIAPPGFPGLYQWFYSRF